MAQVSALATFRRKSRFVRKIEALAKPAEEAGLLFAQRLAHVDEIVADDAESHPSFHPGGSFIAAAVETVPPLQYADSPLTTSSPLLSFAEPTLLLMSAALGALGGVIGNGNPFNTHVPDFGFPLCRVESCIAGYYVYSPPGENERLVGQAGFRRICASDTTEGAARIAKQWREAREKRKSDLVQLEGTSNFEGLQVFLSSVYRLTAERRLLRHLYLAEKEPEATARKE